MQFSGQNPHFAWVATRPFNWSHPIYVTPGLFHRNSCPLGNHSSHICLQRSKSMREPESLCKGMTYDGGICRSQWISTMRMNASHTSFEIETMCINVSTASICMDIMDRIRWLHAGNPKRVRQCWQENEPHNIPEMNAIWWENTSASDLLSNHCTSSCRQPSQVINLDELLPSRTSD